MTAAAKRIVDSGTLRSFSASPLAGGRILAGSCRANRRSPGMGQSARRGFAWRAAYPALCRDGRASESSIRNRSFVVVSKRSHRGVEADRAPGAAGDDLSSAQAIALAVDPRHRLVRRRGYYARRRNRLLCPEGDRAGLMGIVMTASKPLMVFYGSKAKAFRPIRFHRRADGHLERPLLLDMSTAAVPLGKIMAARDTGSRFRPDGASIRTARTSTDPETGQGASCRWRVPKAPGFR